MDAEVGLRPGYYDFSGRSVNMSGERHSPQSNSSGRGNVDGQQKHLDHVTHHGIHHSHHATPASRRSVAATPLSASVTWRSVGSAGNTPNSGQKLSQSPSSAPHPQSSKARSDTKGPGSSHRKGPGGSKYNQIGTHGTPRDVEADSSLATVFEYLSLNLF